MRLVGITCARRNRCLAASWTPSLAEPTEGEPSSTDRPSLDVAANGVASPTKTAASGVAGPTNTAANGVASPTEARGIADALARGWEAITLPYALECGVGTPRLHAMQPSGY